MKTAVNDPTDVETTELGYVVSVDPSNWTVIEEEPAKPFPVMVMFDPTMLLVGFKLTAGVIVKTEFAETAEMSVATILCGPLIDSSVMMFALNDPIVDVATVLGEVVSDVPSNLSVTVEDASKPVPVTVTTVPTDPLERLRVIDALIVKVAEADWDKESIAFTEWPPNVDAGTVNVDVKEPMEFVVTVATVVDPKVIVTVEVGVKLVPETVTDVATAPELGLNDIPGISW